MSAECNPSRYRARDGWEIGCGEQNEWRRSKGGWRGGLWRGGCGEVDVERWDVERWDVERWDVERWDVGCRLSAFSPGVGRHYVFANS